MRVLLSYHYYRQHDLDKLIPKYFTEPYPDIFLDSGAWSAFTQGVHVDIQEYITYVKRNAHWFTVYSNLDDMTNWKATARNQQIMEDAGLRPLPVFHTGEPFEALERYLDLGYPYIALGKIIPYTNTPKAIMPWVLKCFKAARGKAVYHGFGVTNWTLLSSFPWYSADSSSWGAGFRFGRVPVFDERYGRFHAFNLGDRPSCYACAHLIRRYGFEPGDFADRARNDRAKVTAIAAVSYAKAETWLRKRHGEIQMPDNARATGPRVYLADTNPTHFQEAQEGPNGIRVYLATGGNDVTGGMADTGLKVYMADGSLDNLGMGDAGLKGSLAARRRMKA